MIKRRQSELVQLLKSNENYRFTEFQLETTSRCEISDSDWNYKDIPHLKQIHHLVEGYPAYAGDDFISSILVQKVFGIKMPAILFNYQSGPNRQTYYVTLLWYVLIVETTYESLGVNKTRTRTNYAIGCRSWLASLLFPLAKLAIKKNFENLMGGDLPMRDRRGQLREWGYKFKGDGKPYSFYETTLIMETNVLPPKDSPDSQRFAFDLTTLKEGEPIMLGRSDQFGLRVQKTQNTLNFFPRLCPHEGADLSHTCDGKSATCEWHGRKFTPVFSVKADQLRPGFSQKMADRYQLAAKASGLVEVFVTPMIGMEKHQPQATV